MTGGEASSPPCLLCLKCHLLSLPGLWLPFHFAQPLAASRSLVPFCTLAMSGVPEKAEQAWDVRASRGLLIPGRCSSPDVEPLLLLRLTIEGKMFRAQC